MTSSELKPEMQDVLSHVLTSQGLELRSYTISQGCQQGDNYIGEVIRVSVITTQLHSNQIKQCNYIFKCPPSSAVWRKTIESIKFSRNEMNFYQNILPELDTFRIKFGNNKILPMSIPTFYYGSCDDKESDVLVLEDLKVYNYSLVADKMKGLDFNHCKLVLQELGCFHALSIAFKILQPDNFNKIKSGIKEVMFSDEYRETFANINLPCNAALNMIKIRFSDTEHANVIDKTENFIHQFYDKMIKLVECESSLSVINHGDCWSNNIMFQYNQDGTPENLKLLDYQVVRYGSIALDISYFIYNCTQQNTRELYWDTLLDIYLMELNSTLTKYGIKDEDFLVNRKQLDAELVTFGRFGVGMAILIIPLLTSDQPSLDNSDESFDNMHNNQHNNANCFNRLTDIIYDAVKRGILV